MHAWHIIFLGSYLGFLLVGFLVLVVIFITRPSSSKTVFSLENSLRFRCGNITGSTLRKVPHLHMCVYFALFMVLVALSLSVPFQRSWSQIIRSLFAKDLSVLLFLHFFKGTKMSGPCSEISEPQSGDLRVAEDFYQVQISVAY